jgi:hypothetical protein
VSITVEQAQVSGFTINSSSPIIDFGKSATISGVLAGTSTPTPITLCSHTDDHRTFACNQVPMTGSDGSYSFSVSPSQNTLYQVRTSLPPKRHTAVLFEGVRDLVTITASSSDSTLGDTVTFTGTVTPDKAGHVIYLQRLGQDGDWHTVAISEVTHDSTYRFTWTFGSPGQPTFRARITSDEHNVGAASPPVTINVATAPASSLPPAS